MTVMNDVWIAEQCGWALDPASSMHYSPVDASKRMIAPFAGRQMRGRGDGKSPIISFGLSSFGYDVRIAGTFKVFRPTYGNVQTLNDVVIDPKQHDDDNYETISVGNNERFIIPPNGFVLGHTVERLCIPRDVLVICLGKSTYARLGLVVNITPLEPEWEGEVVIEISNTTDRPVAIYANEGIAQFLFLKGNAPCNLSYADRSGKYQGQLGVQTALI